ncbi:uncharacterized protein EDB93DRAFT_1090238 [Suillus bovinus]|uniref:uncharacterized protein n=1 Tax=Suillus bovinus TaxID=48563 RepID=UPI001B882BA5|nr:uncharacterized protein EDB93DRAFT_1090238 [Suillus bovinus]KAG2139210.1 hypothetical protein EDB93DRAFT_1090238 [Suillus bovinus]
MLHSFIKTTKLCCWLSRPDCPPAIQECKVLFDRMYAPKSIASLDEELAVLCARLKFNSVIYSRASTHIGNSQVFFYPQGDQLTSPVPGSIHHIYAMPTGELVFAVLRQLPLNRHNHTIDPFAVYPDFPAKLYSLNLSSYLETIKVSWVIGHFAQWQILSDHVAILSLCRVSTVILKIISISV